MTLNQRSSAPRLLNESELTYYQGEGNRSKIKAIKKDFKVGRPRAGPRDHDPDVYNLFVQSTQVVPMKVGTKKEASVSVDRKQEPIQKRESISMEIDFTNQSIQITKNETTIQEEAPSGQSRPMNPSPIPQPKSAQVL